MAIFILSSDKWLQLTEPVSQQEARDYLAYYEGWFPSDKFKMEAAQG